MASQAEDLANTVGATDIAIIGMAGEFPGAHDTDALWSLVKDGRTAIRTLTDEELRLAGVPDEMLANPNYVRVAARLDDLDQFDASFFGAAPRDAEIMDPQHRRFLQCCWTALEHAGHAPGSLTGAVSVYAGCGVNGYLINNLLTNPELVDSMGMFVLRHTNNDKDFLATSVSYRLNLNGASVSVQTACSTSLVAIHLAAQALLAGECDMAIAGGVTIEIPHGAGYLYREGEVLSPTGACRAFDAAADGTVLGSGAGVVVLRRLADAVADGDTIHAVIKATAVNNDGSGKVGYMAPSVDGHAAVVSEALAIGGISAESIQYFEAHGTGTLMGDPVEVAAVTRAYRADTERTGFIRVGSTKPNLGHLDTAAGVASVIKTVQALKHRSLPPLANFTQPNPLLELDRTPFYVSTELSEWKTDGGPRRAGVSSLGVGGTNAHVILEEAPSEDQSGPDRSMQLLVLSAKTESALERATADLAVYLDEHPYAKLADVAHTLQVGRTRFPYRRALATDCIAEAVTILHSKDAPRLASGTASEGKPEVVFSFPGGGTQYPNMGRELYETEPIFRTEVDRCIALLGPELGPRVREALYPQIDSQAEAEDALERASLQLPAIFLTEYALAKLWISLGVQPAVLAGHSLGEYTAACLAGVLSLEDALAVVSLRGRIMDHISDAAMISVPLPETEARALAEESSLDIALINAPGLSVLAGRPAQIAALQDKLDASGIETRRLRLAGASHCSLLEPYLDEFAARLASVRFRPPQIPFVSNVTGGWADPSEVQQPEYWVRHLRSTVRYADAMATLLTDRDCIQLEVGPGNALTSLARVQPLKPRAAIPSMPHPRDQVPAPQYLFTALGHAWIAGLDVHWTAIHSPGHRRRLPLPTYPFEQQRHWIDAGSGSTRGGSGFAKRADLGTWFYRPIWKQAELLVTPDLATPRRWLIFLDSRGIGRSLTMRLRRAGHDVITVEPARKLERVAKDAYRLDVTSKEAHTRLIGALAAGAGVPSQIVHFWSMCTDAPAISRSRNSEGSGTAGFYSLLYLAQALTALELDQPVRLAAISAGAYRVLSEDTPHPEGALLLGPVLVLPRESSQVSTVAIDIVIPPGVRNWRRRSGTMLADAILDECIAESTDRIVALRDGKRWVEDYDPVRLPKPTETMLPLKEHGVYLITGGLTGIGAEVAHYLAKTHAARLVLVGRTPLPEPVDWPKWLAAHSDEDPTSCRIRAAQACEQAGGEVLALTANVASREDMRRVEREAQCRFGTIHGVFHAAGQINDALMQFKSAESVEAVLTPKVQGTLNLAAAFRGQSLDFLVLFSSTSSILGLAGQVDYTAANAFENAFAAAQEGNGIARIVAIDWGIWRQVGMAARAAGSQLPIRQWALPDGEDDTLITSSTLDARVDWMLNEHRTSSGTAILPGTAYLELVRDAAAAVLKGGIELRGVSLIAPLVVADGAKATVRIVLTEADQHYRFALDSAQDGTFGAKHAVGTLAAVGTPIPPALDLAAIEARCTERTVEFAPGEQLTRQERQLRFGPRWKVLRRIALGRDEALARLELARQFADDLRTAPLHPGLLDLASTFALPLIRDYERHEGLYIPMSYGAIRIYRPLTSRIASHARLRAGWTSADEMVAFDLTITDDSGQVLVEIDDFSLRRVPSFDALLGDQPVQSPRRQLSPYRRADRAPSFDQGIMTSEGIEALVRILAAKRLSRLIVSPVDLQALRMSLDLPAASNQEQERAASDRPQLQSAYAAPSDDVEHRLAALWQEVLGVRSVGIHDDFFELGGHSLIGARLFSRIKAMFGVDLGLSVLFEAPTVARLAARVRTELGQNDGLASGDDSGDHVRTRPDQPSLVPIQTGGTKRPIFCIHGMYGNVLNFRELATHLGPDQPFYGLQAQGLDGTEPPFGRIEEMAAHYLREIRGVQPAGPYFLCGYSAGGLIAFEMARQLLARGEQVSRLVMLDTFCPSMIPPESLSWRPRPSMSERATELSTGVTTSGFPYLVGWARLAAVHRLASASRESASGAIESLDDVRDNTSERVGESFLRSQSLYTLAPSEVPIMLVRAVSRLEYRPIPQDLGWGTYSRAGVETYNVPGSHFTMLSQPNVLSVARTLRRIMRADQAEQHINERDQMLRRPSRADL
jgi:acyl transferase domain-containing protein/thioesterase domain-containing protein